MFLWLLLLCQHVAGEMMPGLSFEAPFELIGPDGERKVSNEWQKGGVTEVKKHFIRLTTDRQSKRGFIWNTKKLDVDEFSIIFTFRISGQGKKWFGDGIGLWITTNPSHISGEHHGYTEKYTGVGIIFDTFRNLEHEGGHKDVAVIVNDGTMNLDQINEQPRVGCDAPGIRYYEKNAAFSAAVNASRAKIQYKNNLFKVSMDPSNTGNWFPCYETTITNLPEGWHRQATLGVTATTGSLADNHDILGLVVYDNVQDMDHTNKDIKVKEKTAKEKDVQDINTTDEERVRELQKQLVKLQEEFEHQFAALKEQTENTISKLRLQEEDDERRIDELEMIVSGKVNEKMSSELNTFSRTVDVKLKQAVDENISQSTGWKTPFFILVVIILGIVFMVHKKYTELRKSHLL